MPGSVLDVFALLGRISEDAPLSEKMRVRAEEIVRDPKDHKDERFTHLYQESERELLRRGAGGFSQEMLQRQVAVELSKSDGDYQGFRMTFMLPERQLTALASELIVAYAAECRAFIGTRAVTRMMAASLEGTPWQETAIDPVKGIVFNGLRMRSLAEIGELVAMLMEGWYARMRLVLGNRASQRTFERAYESVAATRGFLPMMKNLLGLTPHDAMWAEKVKRLHELEGETSTQARSIRAADVDLNRQADQLQRTVVELQAVKRQLEAVGKARSEFIDVVSHQFRTPLSSIRWNGELLADAVAEKQIPAEFNDAVETVRLRSVYLIETLERVFAALDIETGELSLAPKPAFLWEAVQDAYGQFEKEIARRGLTWKFAKTKGQLQEIPFDKAKIATVLKILIGNAIAYDKEGGKITATVEAATIDGRDYQVCAISDEGLGLSKEDADRVFDKFFRSQPSVLKVADGTGLGMFIVKNFIEAHQGRVKIESGGEGKGTTVSFALPVK